MSFQQWMDKKKGDKLKATEVNELARQAYRKPGPASHVPGQHTSRVDLSGSYPPFFQTPVEIESLDECTFIYKVKTLYYVGGNWEKTGPIYNLITSYNYQHLCIGDRLNAYWHDQCDAFVPTHPEPFKAYLTSNLYPFGHAIGKTICNSHEECEDLCDVDILDSIGLVDAYWMPYVPVGTCVFLWPQMVSEMYLLLAIGGPCCGESTSSSSSSSSSLSSSSLSSTSSSSTSSLSSGYGCPTEISGVPVSSLETVTPEVGDYVLGWKDGCIVLFPIDDCVESSST